MTKNDEGDNEEAARLYFESLLLHVKRQRRKGRVIQFPKAPPGLEATPQQEALIERMRRAEAVSDKLPQRRRLKAFLLDLLRQIDEID